MKQRNVINFYKSNKEIGNHEDIFKKVGEDFLKELSYIVTYVSEDSDATVECGEATFKLSSGFILGLNAVVRTNESRIEISTSTGNIFRLGPNSEFCLENTIEGLSPVYYGDVFVSFYDNTVFSGGKDRTSCWLTKETAVLTKRIDNKSDCYYTLDRPMDIYEYDECGRRFHIVHVEPFHKCVLSFDFSKQMRERYTVQSKNKLTLVEVENIYSEYVIPTKWLEEYSSVNLPEVAES